MAASHSIFRSATMNQTLEVTIGQYTHAGRKPVNQDFHGAFVPTGSQLTTKGITIALADGISSSNVSQIASESAIASFIQDYYSTPDSWSVKTSAQRVLEAINSWLYAQTQRSEHRFNRDWGYVCTFSALVLKSNSAHLFHSGDTRVYKCAGQTLEQLTTDHRKTVSADTSYLTRALGFHDRLELDYQLSAVSQGDTFVLATDGVYEFLDSADLTRAINTAKSNNEDLNLVAKNLVLAALENGSTDNLTLQIVRIDRLPPRHLSELRAQVDSTALPPPLTARMRFDGFEIIRDIYISSRSHVFLARDIDSNEQVILKAPSAEMRNNPEYLESLLMEEWIARRIDNPNVLKAVEPKRKRNYLYLVLEYIEGQTLEQWMIDNPKPDIPTVRDILVQIAKGLQAFHRREMVHQDLRPKNIMIDASGTVKIIDFGATKVAGISEQAERNHGVMGTAQFTAPEYYLGYSGNNQADIFSLGAITYKMLSGDLPYGNTISRTRNSRDQARLTYQTLSKHGSDVPGWIDYALQKATQIDPLKRYSEISEFVYEFNKPSADYLKKEKPPLLERHPVMFWKVLSILSLLTLVVHCSQQH